MPGRRVLFKLSERESRELKVDRSRATVTFSLLSTFYRSTALCGEAAVARVGVEPTASLVLSQGGLPVAYRAVVVFAVPRAGVEPANIRV